MEQQPAQTPKVTVLTTEEIQEVDRLPTPISCLLGSKHTVFKTVAPVDDMQKLEANTLLIQAIQDQQNAGRLEQCLEYVAVNHLVVVPPSNHEVFSVLAV